MKEDRFDELMRDAAETYRKPVAPDFDAMWKGIEAEHFGGRVTGGREERGVVRWATNRWVGIAATLLIGIGVGRVSTSLEKSAKLPVAAAVPEISTASANTAAVTHDESLAAQPYDRETSKYLGQTAALLVSLPNEVKAGRADAQFVSRAVDLLTTTRLLLDSPAAKDPAMRNLFEDLELVLAQVVRLQNNRGTRTELDLITEALQQRDVLPRLRTAVADISAN
ncbi:MAG: hypothetical protein ABJF01_22520 [bacterium]